MRRLNENFEKYLSTIIRWLKKTTSMENNLIHLFIIKIFGFEKTKYRTGKVFCTISLLWTLMELIVLQLKLHIKLLVLIELSSVWYDILIHLVSNRNVNFDIPFKSKVTACMFVSDKEQKKINFLCY